MFREPFSPLEIPGDLPAEELPDLLRYWYLGSRARRHMMLKRFFEVDRELFGEPGLRVLDVGCSWGFNVISLELKRYTTVGVDLVPEPLAVGARVARANGASFKVVCADAAGLPFPDGTFDAVTMVETLEHVYEEDRPKVVEECRRVLKPGGRLVISTPNYSGLVERVKRVATKKPWFRKMLPGMCYPAGSVGREAYHPYHYHLPQPVDKIRSLLEEGGFKVLKIRHVVFVLKNTPNIIFPLCAIAEKVCENIPHLKTLAATVIFSSIKS